MPTVIVGILFYGSAIVGIWAGCKVGGALFARFRSMFLSWAAGIAVFLALPTAINLTLSAAIPDYSRRLDRVLESNDEA